MPSQNPSAEFGANEWLVDEMREKFNKDPNSVDKVWWEFFRNDPSTANGASNNGATTTTTEPTPAAAAAAASPAPTPVAKPSLAESGPSPAQVPAATTAAKPVPKEPERAERTDANDEPTYHVLRGIPAATAKNMEVSLAVPTATSVRNIPVKLL